jgi:membrane-bound acyltransferase YfiQ involved in biofilm formation
MASIVVVHSANGVLGLAQMHRNLAIAVVIPFKFATVGFFLISGFLLGERIDRCKPVEYFMRRFRRVFLPWSLWFALMSALLVVRGFTRQGAGYSSLGKILAMVFTTSRSVLYDTSYWFVPNLLICIAILLIFRGFLHSPKFGMVLLAVNLAYVANIYAHWFPAGHTKALFAFVFYLWLGSYASQNFERINNFLARIPAAVFAATTLIAGIAAYHESYLLALLNNPDVLNTLRLSNQIFSVSVVLLIFKFSRATWPAFVDVRRDTFGLYLSHSILLLFLVRWLKNSRQWMSDSIYVRDVEGVMLWIAVSVVTYMSCLMLTTWLANRPSLQWVVGLGPHHSKPLAP